MGARYVRKGMDCPIVSLNELKIEYERIIRDLKKELKEKEDIISNVGDLHKKSIDKIRQYYKRIVNKKDKEISELNRTYEQKLTKVKKELKETKVTYHELIKSLRDEWS